MEILPVRPIGQLRMNSSGMEFVSVSAGNFQMGSPMDERGRDDDERQDEVRTSKGFWVGKFDVTQGEWEAFVESNPRGYTVGAPWSPVECPAVNVSWRDTQAFIRWLNERESGSGHLYRLPTEAEWEYAARAGTNGAR